MNRLKLPIQKLLRNIFLHFHNKLAIANACQWICCKCSTSKLFRNVPRGTFLSCGTGVEHAGGIKNYFIAESSFFQAFLKERIKVWLGDNHYQSQNMRINRNFLLKCFTPKSPKMFHVEHFCPTGQAWNMWNTFL